MVVFTTEKMKMGNITVWRTRNFILNYDGVCCRLYVHSLEYAKTAVAHPDIVCWKIGRSLSIPR